jgi:hypothetical protein
LLAGKEAKRLFALRVPRAFAARTYSAFMGTA